MVSRKLKLAGVCAALCAFPLLALAQTQPAQTGDLQSSVRAAIMNDPRTATMSQAQVDAMVAALSQGAQQQGVTPQDLTWHAGPTSAVTTGNFCAPYPRYLCIMSATFGFFGPDYLMPIWLAVLSLLFLLINGLLRHHERLLRAARSA
jgi:hypothetical protein